MICTPIPGGFVCGSRARRPKCSVPGCTNLTEVECDFAVKRRNPAASQTCDAKLCGACKVVQSDGKDFCAPHDRLAKRLKADASVAKENA